MDLANRQLLDEAIVEQDRCLARFKAAQRSLRTSTDAHEALLNRPNRRGIISQAENQANMERERRTTLNEIASRD
jgi:hypothetical protein